MNLARTITNKQPRVVSTLTIILLFWVIGGTVMQYSEVWSSWSEPVAKEQSVPADDADEKTTTTLSSFQEAVIPISKIQILFICNFFREWILIEEDNLIISNEIPLPPSQFFLTLFRQIISPNAP